MKQVRAARARAAAAMLIVALLGAACAPLPSLQFGDLTPTVSVFVPEVPAGSPGAESPLEPTAAVTVTLPAPATAVVASTPVSPTVTPVPTLTPYVAPPALIGPAWEWVSSSFKDGTVLAPGDPARYTFQLVGYGNALVQADCNFGTGTWRESGSELTFDAIGTTKMACPPDSLDSAFLAQLRNAASYRLGSDVLVINLKDDAGTMSLRPASAEAEASAEPATGTPVASESPAPIPTRTPLPTGTPWPTPEPTETPGQLRPTPALISMALPLPTSMTARARLPVLNGTGWLLADLSVEGQAVPPTGATPITLKFAADGSQVTGSTGCNDYWGTLRKDGAGVLAVRPALTTNKACGAAAMIQEVEFMDALLRTRGYMAQGNELTFTESAGSALLVFVKK